MTAEITHLLRQVRALARSGALAGVLVHMNDTYAIEERRLADDTLTLPGLARVGQLIEDLRGITLDTMNEDRTLVVHSGDFLAPSSIGLKSRGEHMMELLKQLRLGYLTLGNHEFDYEPDHPSNLKDLLRRFNVRPVVCNLRHPEIETVAWAVWPAGDPVIAITGVVGSQTCKASGKAPRGSTSGWTAEAVEPAVRRTIQEIQNRHEKVRTLVVLSHMNRPEDHDLMHLLHEVGWFDWRFILGGHDHNIDWIEAQRTWTVLLKNLSNAKTVTVILLTWPTLCHSSLGGQWVRAVREPDADPKEFFQGFPAPARVYMEQVVEEQTRAGRKRADTLARLLEAAEDLGTIRTTLRAVDFAGVEPLNSVQVAVDTYLTTYGQPNDARLVVDFTEQIRDPTATLDARDESLRAQSTDFGNFVADCARRHFRSDLAIVNAGSFRLDDFVPPAITLRILRETFLYDEANALVEVTIPISACEAVLKHGITKRGSGAFLQISCGEGVQVDPRTGAVTVVGDQRDVRVAVSSFLLTSAEDEDGYLAALQQRGHGPDQVSGWLKGLAGKRGVGALPLIAAALRLVRGAEQPHGSVVDAVVQQAAEVRYDPSVRLTSSADVDALVFDTEQLRRPMDVLLKQRQTHYHALEAITEETKERARRITGADFSSEVCDAAGALRETLVRLINDRGVDHVRQILDRVLKDERGFRDSENARTG